MDMDTADRMVGAFRDEASFCFARITGLAQEAISEFDHPHVRMRPAVYLDGNQWCALYGTNIQEGVCGFGKSPADACAEFDRAWYEKAVRK